VDKSTFFRTRHTIIIETTGEGEIRAHGFTKNEVKRMKSIILDRL